MKKIIPLFFLITFLPFFSFNTFAQQKNNAETKPDTLLSASTFSGLAFRSIGPAFMSGRIADVAIHPQDEIPGTWV